MRLDYARANSDYRKTKPHIYRQRPRWNDAEGDLTHADIDPNIIFRSVKKLAGSSKPLPSWLYPTAEQPSGILSTVENEPEPATGITPGDLEAEAGEEDRQGKTTSSGVSDTAIVNDEVPPPVPEERSTESASGETLREGGSGYFRPNYNKTLLEAIRRATEAGTIPGPVPGLAVSETSSTASSTTPAVDPESPLPRQSSRHSSNPLRVITNGIAPETVTAPITAKEDLTSFSPFGTRSENAPVLPNGNQLPSPPETPASTWVRKWVHSNAKPGEIAAGFRQDSVRLSMMLRPKTASQPAITTEGLTSFPQFELEGDDIRQPRHNIERLPPPKNQDFRRVHRVVDGALLEPEGHIAAQPPRYIAQPLLPDIQSSDEEHEYAELDSESDEDRAPLLPHERPPPPAGYNLDRARESLYSEFSAAMPATLDPPAVEAESSKWKWKGKQPQGSGARSM